MSFMAEAVTNECESEKLKLDASYILHRSITYARAPMGYSDMHRIDSDVFAHAYCLENPCNISNLIDGFRSFLCEYSF